MLRKSLLLHVLLKMYSTFIPPSTDITLGSQDYIIVKYILYTGNTQIRHFIFILIYHLAEAKHLPSSSRSFFQSSANQKMKVFIWLITWGLSLGTHPLQKKAVIYSPLHRQYERVHRELLMDGWLVRRECNCQMLMRLQKKGPGEEVKRKNVGVRQLPSDVS